MEKKEMEIIPPVSRDAIKAELVPDRFLRRTNNANNEIYVMDANDSPMVMRELGRLRELSFRMAGGGTGQALDIDSFDTTSPAYKQLVVWDPQAEEIVGGYRFIICRDAGLDENGIPRLATSELFHFSPLFINDYLPNTIELGRSFVQPAYQPSRENRKSIYSLDNLWDGLGALVVDNSYLKYFFGKVTMYTHFNKYARDLILFFLNRFFPDHDKLVYPLEPLPLHTPGHELEKHFSCESFNENYKMLLKLVREQREHIPPLFNSYMSLSPSMRTFGTSMNNHFGGVEETGIMVTIGDIYDAKKERHVNSYLDKPFGINLK